MPKITKKQPQKVAKTAKVAKTKTKVSKTKQRQQARSARTLIQKLDAHTTADDLFNIVKSVENGVDTKQSPDQAASAQDPATLASLVNVKEDVRRDEATRARLRQQKQREKQQIDEQLKLIESFNL